MSPLSCISRLSAGQMVGIFTFINILNYLDRGIVPGAFESIGDFIREDLRTNNTDVEQGLLQSTYIVGYATASVSFGHLVHTFPPFKLMAFGLGIWVLAVLASGFAPRFWVLILARVFSGVGEASFQTVIPPFLDDAAPPDKRGLWLSIFFMAIPVGTALGYVVGGNISPILGWRAAFYLEAVPMLPFVVLVWFMPYNKHRREALQEIERHHHDGTTQPAQDEDSEVDRELREALRDDEAAAEDVVPVKPTFWQELTNVIMEPLYLSIVLGYAAYTAVMAGIGSFGPNFVKGLGLFPDQATASLMFGAAVSAAGAVGTPMGGYLLDWATKRQRRLEAEAAVAALNTVNLLAMRRSSEKRGFFSSLFGGRKGSNNDSDDATAMLTDLEAEEALMAGAAGVGTQQGVASGISTPEIEDSTDPATVDLKLNVALPQAVWMTVIGIGGCVGGVLLGSSNAGLFFTMLSIGSLMLCATTAGINQSMMAAVRPESRSFAIGIGTLLVHALGDVPAPPIIGAIADQLSPESCTPDSVATAAGQALGAAWGAPSTQQLSDCTRSASGLQLTLAIVMSWLIWPVLLWTVAWALAIRRSAARKAAAAAAAATAGASAGSGLDVSYSAGLTDTSALITVPRRTGGATPGLKGGSAGALSSPAASRAAVGAAPTPFNTYRSPGRGSDSFASSYAPVQLELSTVS